MHKTYLSAETPVSLKIAVILPFLGAIAMIMFVSYLGIQHLYLQHKIKNYNEDIYKTYTNFVKNKDNIVWIKSIPVDYIKVEQNEKRISYVFPVGLKRLNDFSQGGTKITPFTILNYVYQDFVNNGFKVGEIKSIMINDKELNMDTFLKIMAKENSKRNMFDYLSSDLEKAKNITVSLMKSGAENNE